MDSPSTKGGSRKHDALQASLVRRLQRKEEEVHRLAQLSDKKDSAIRLLLVMKVSYPKSMFKGFTFF